MTEYNPQAEYEAALAAHEEQRDRAALEDIRIENACSCAGNAQLKDEFTCPLCGMPLELCIECSQFLPSAPLEYGGEVACDCVTGESLPLLIVKGASQADVERLAREKWNAMPHSKLRAEIETLLVSEDTLARLVRLIDSAGISNLSNGVQLGQMSWHIKMTDTMTCARACLAETRRES